MKKIICVVLVVALALTGFMGLEKFRPKERSVNIVSGSSIEEREATGDGLKLHCKSAVLIDAGTGRVLYSKNEHKKLPPASVTKVMTMLLVMEAIESGKIKLDDKVTVSERASSMGGSQMYMEPGEQHTVEEMMMGVAMVSANDACVAMGEHISGSVEMFVEKMNKKAAELGMMDTNFMNTNGLPVAQHYTSAYDIALMTKALIRYDIPKKWFTTWQKQVKVGKKNKDFTLTNTNRLIRNYPGAFGVKTGFTNDAGYCLSGAAQRGNTVLISVIMGSPDTKKRFAGVSKMLDFGFANFETKKVAKNGQIKDISQIEKGRPGKLKAVLKEDICVLIEKAKREKITSKVEMDSHVKAPIKKGDKVGELVIYHDGKEKERYPLVAQETICRTSVFGHYIKLLQRIVDGGNR